MKPGVLVLIALLSSCSIMEAQQNGNKGIVRASELACHTARQDMERAIEAYGLLEGSPPANEMVLVPNYLVMASPLMDLDRQGNVVAAPSAGCP